MGSLSPWGFQGEGSLGFLGLFGFTGVHRVLLFFAGVYLSLSLHIYIYMCEICIRTRRSKSHMLNPGGLGCFGSLGCACVSVWVLCMCATYSMSKSHEASTSTSKTCLVDL